MKTQAISHVIPADQVQKFMLAGDAILTFQSSVSEQYFTYRIVKDSDKDLWYVKVLNSADNVGGYAYIGCMYYANGKVCFKLPKQPKISAQALSVVVFTWVVDHLPFLKALSKINIRHEGYCCKCGRVLTTPDSIVAGIGPVCAGKMRKEEAKKAKVLSLPFSYNAPYERMRAIAYNL